MLKRALLPLTAILCSTLAAQTAPPKAQIAPDIRAFNAARATPDPDQKIAALRKFTQDFPDSTRKGFAHSLIFAALLDNFAQRTQEIDEEARFQIKGEKSYEKWNDEVEIAQQLAAVEPAGVDLKRAQDYSKDALKNLTEPNLDKFYLSHFTKSEPAPKLAAIHAFYARARAGALAASAFVAYRQGNLPQATAQLDEAYALDPLSADVNALRGDLAYAQHRNPEALTSLERAQVSGGLSKYDRALLLQLYSEANPARDLQDTLDTTYRQLYPEPFHPAPHTPSPAGHTALFELYTGSGCPPCVGGDLAVEALMQTHPRTELVALVYDLHIPKPDPLTSPDTVARADFYGVNSTPSYVLDGRKLGAFGGPRDDAEDLYDKLSKQVDQQAAKPSSVQLTLSADPGTTIAAHATVTLGDLAALANPTSPVLPAPKPPAPAPAAAKSPAKPQGAAAKPLAPTPPAVTPRYLLNFALVEDDVRYSGENGIRFHRMVVRALAKPSAEGFPLVPGQSVTLDTTFDPAAIAAASRTYLDGYEKSNDRFGPMQFLTKDTTMQTSHLAIAAWVQDAETHRILQSALIPLTPAIPQAGTK